MEINTAPDFDRLAQDLQSLGVRAVRVAKNAVNQAAKVLQRRIQAAAPIGTARKVRGQLVPGGGLRRSIGAKTLKGNNHQAGAKVGIGVGMTRAKDYGDQGTKTAAKHAHLVALGTTDRYTGVKARRTKTGRLKVTSTGNATRYTGRMPSNQFVPRAAEAATPEVLQTIEAVCRKQLTPRPQ